jgi:hypothetical protein
MFVRSMFHNIRCAFFMSVVKVRADSFAGWGPFPLLDPERTYGKCATTVRRLYD